MFDPFYESEYLGRVLYLEDLKDLNRSDYSLLESELNLAIGKMKKIKGIDCDDADTDLLSKINLKLRVCEKFLKRISQVKQHDLLRVDEYHLVFLRQRLANHLGPMAADKMMNEARQDAFRQLNKESIS